MKSEPMSVGTEMNQRRVLKVTYFRGILRTARYLVLNLNCGHKVEISHKRMIESRRQNGMCKSCARIAAVANKSIDIQRAEPPPRHKECDWAHGIWDRSLRLG